MSIRVRFFASLKEQVGYSETMVSSDQVATVGDVLQQVDRASVLTGRLLYAVNMEYAKLDTPVAEGDEVAFFPPVTGGEP
ncbi:MAG: molybdopterin converting factor subunit 1 [Methylococcales bacterium]|nr:molybdopterin converting factor subunit 1 [Methylococcales bacterium]